MSISDQEGLCTITQITQLISDNKASVYIPSLHSHEVVLQSPCPLSGQHSL